MNQHDRNHTDRRQPPATAAGEAFHEVEDAETHLLNRRERRRKDGEAADALTPNEGAQEDADRDRT
ncbi:hypothetical protein ACIOTI_42115 [Streptomyces sp. NPDC087843]|uniref:hypothetical protein n=1 Tax=Streptomyces sp. NPDC087843 TaxID=3365804 RepID=UPI0037FDF5ED